MSTTMEAKYLRKTDALDAAARVRLRLQEALDEKHLTQRAIASLLTRAGDETWTQVRVGRVLNGSVELKVSDVEAIAAVAGLSLVELFREPGREYVADLTPSELRLVNAARRAPARILAMLQLLEPDPKQR